ncbi:LysR family transcriptional regulator [Leptolyngbya sp. FACHB-261]|uniref:LysR family transcriptional regulator n=1 Tax=Leptolyngbya sp. FACHB-261 TaxID=2692806 RepID=UPI00168241EB|nr:LysR family transcriptional regulator [Leptolyngbya sp. FACHB-261]MBD2102346.1 LysR family transcriptional regulator [Leptolyngbya sp. FACHB-261]
MELHYLRYFLAVAEELHFSRAAERLHITQPALSRQIHSLENELGVELFRRTKRMVVLTDAGVAFLPEVRKALQQVEQAIQVAQQAARGEIGLLRIAFTPSAMHTMLPEILRRFRNYHANVKLDMTELCTLDQVNALRTEAVDIGLLHPPIEAPFLKLYPLPGEKLVVAIPQAHSLAKYEQLPLKALANEPFILHPRYEGPVLYDQIVALCRQAGFDPHIVHEEVKHQTRVGLVAAGMGVTFIPESLQQSVPIGVVYRTLTGSAPELQLAAAWRNNRVSPVLQEFLNVIQETSTILGGQPV